MPRRDWELRISDILDAITAVLQYTKGMKYKTFVADRKIGGCRYTQLNCHWRSGKSYTR